MKILFTVCTNTYFKGQTGLGFALCRANLDEVVYFFPNTYPELDNHINQLIDSNVVIQKNSKINHFFSKLANFASQRAFGLFFIPAEIARLMHLKHSFAWLLKKHAIEILVLPANQRYDQPLFSRVAKTLGIPVVIIPAWVASNEIIEIARAANGRGYAYDLKYWIAHTFWPKWTKLDSDGSNLLAASLGYIFTREILGLAPANPWLLHSGISNSILMESESMKHLALSSGLEPAKLIITGSVTHDLMNSDLLTKESVWRKSKETKILVALPPNMFASRVNRGLEFESYIQMITTWLEEISKFTNSQILLSLHPTTQQEELGDISGFNLSVSSEPIETLIPGCDVFIASISATIQWALACRKPVINFDCYAYDYPDYKAEKNVKLATTLQEFRNLISEIPQLIAYSKENPPTHWGDVDGKAVQRIRGQLMILVNSDHAG